ncbi:MAG: hypothetical protein HLUCCO18_07170 [Rhodobacteraceae bacterium HLUCCO18]|nr:MAG: hypothetical protein HLUCCO18_07170 [Rhodobacteraceae bacterium HLUCCO18]
MPNENQAEVFIRVLVEDFENNRVIRKSDLSRRFKAQTKRFKQLFKSDRKPTIDAMEPLDCLQMMSKSQESHIR